MRRVTILCILLCCTLFSSCESLPVYQEKMELDKTDFSIPAEGGKLKVSFVPLSDWTVSCGEKFLTYTPTSGTASEEMTEILITVEENKAAAERFAKMVLSFQTNDIVLTITQAAAIIETPGTPENPEDPENPGTPENPENPEDPGTPGTPENPEDPEDPEDPENPGTPENPDDPSTPGQGSGSTEDVVPGKDVNTK